jgi:hypothetical protein
MLVINVKKKEENMGLDSEKKGRIIIQKRDIKILEFLNNMSIGDLDIITNYFFKSFPASRRRLNKLMYLGLISLSKTKSPYGFNSYILSQKGFKFLSENSKENIIPCYQNSKNKLYSEHDRMVALIRVFLKKKEMFLRWISERELLKDLSGVKMDEKRFFTPDGVIVTKNNEKIAIEYELSRKSKSRIKDKIDYHISLLNEGTFDGSMFITKNKTIYEFIQKETEGFSQITHYLASDIENEYVMLSDRLSR